MEIGFQTHPYHPGLLSIFTSNFFFFCQVNELGGENTSIKKFYRWGLWRCKGAGIVSPAVVMKWAVDH